jgi:hypothetical protein
MSQRRLVWLLVVFAAAVPYLPTLHDYFVQDDFGVVGLLSAKPAGYFPRWFVTPWMDDIWGYMPDEIRPFTAITYQVAALWGPASPVTNHAINIAFHVVNSLLVLGVAEIALGLSLRPAGFAAIVFALLPMQPESVAWVTGRVDSMPACFYLAAFLLYARWRSSPRASFYVWSVVAYFVALFTKQNTVTLPAALLLYDAIIVRRRVRLSWSWLWPYVPFVLLTAGYLALRYMLFGEVAREGTLSQERIRLFLQDLSTHIRRMAFGEAGVRLSELTTVVWVGACIAFVAWSAALFGERGRTAAIWRRLSFSAVWIVLGVAPTLVAGYASPRHMYLASAGWGLALGAAFDVFWRGRPRKLMTALAIVFGGTVLTGYAYQLSAEVRLWGIRSDVSRLAVADIEREAMAAPPGTLFIVDAPRRSWDFALPYALRPPFTREDLSRRVLVISHSSIHCCPAYLWDAHVRQVVRAWTANPARPPIIALRWDWDTGELFRLSDREEPFLRTLVPLLLETKDVTALDRLILDISNKLVVRRPP